MPSPSHGVGSTSPQGQAKKGAIKIVTDSSTWRVSPHPQKFFEAGKVDTTFIRQGIDIYPSENLAQGM